RRDAPLPERVGFPYSLFFARLRQNHCGGGKSSALGISALPSPEFCARILQDARSRPGSYPNPGKMPCGAGSHPPPSALGGRDQGRPRKKSITIPSKSKIRLTTI